MLYAYFRVSLSVCTSYIRAILRFMFITDNEVRKWLSSWANLNVKLALTFYINKIKLVYSHCVIRTRRFWQWDTVLCQPHIITYMPLISCQVTRPIPPPPVPALPLRSGWNHTRLSSTLSRPQIYDNVVAGAPIDPDSNQPQEDFHEISYKYRYVTLLWLHKLQKPQTHSNKMVRWHRTTTREYVGAKEESVTAGRPWIMREHVCVFFFFFAIRYMMQRYCMFWVNYKDALYFFCLSLA